MTDRSFFSDEQWQAIVDAPVAIMLAMTVVGDHGPISMMKESAAGARTITRPPHSGPADGLIAQIAPEAEGKEARHEAKQHKGATPNVIVDVTSSIDRQIAALIRHESQMPGFNVPTGETIGARVKKGAVENAAVYGFEYGAVFRRLIARR